MWWEFVCLVVGIRVWEYGNACSDWKTGWVQHSSRANANNSPLLWEMGAGLNPLSLFTDICGPKQLGEDDEHTCMIKVLCGGKSRDLDHRQLF